MKRVVSVLISLAIVGGLVWYRAKKSDEVEAKVIATQAKLADMIQHAKDADKFSTFVDSNADAAHQHAMQLAYTPAVRRRPPSFDAAKYVNAFCDNLIKKASFQNASDQQLSLFVRQLAIDVEQAAKQGEFD